MPEGQHLHVLSGLTDPSLGMVHATHSASGPSWHLYFASALGGKCAEPDGFWQANHICGHVDLGAASIDVRAVIWQTGEAGGFAVDACALKAFNECKQPSCLLWIAGPAIQMMDDEEQPASGLLYRWGRKQSMSGPIVREQEWHCLGYVNALSSWLALCRSCKIAVS